MGEKLFDASGNPKHFLPLEGADHHDTYLIDPGEYFKPFAAFARDKRL
jgi:hypothetical protein